MLLSSVCGNREAQLRHDERDPLKLLVFCLDLKVLPVSVALGDRGALEGRRIRTRNQEDSVR